MQPASAKVKPQANTVCGKSILEPSYFYRSSPVLLPDVEPAVRLMTVFVKQNTTELTIETPVERDGPRRYMASVSGATSWLPASPQHFTNVPSLLPDKKQWVYSYADCSIAYKNSATADSSFRRSADGERSWETILPRVAALGQVTGVRVISSSFHHKCRGYVQVMGIGGTVFVTNDCGKTLDVYARDTRYVIESRSTPTIIYGVSSANDLVISADSGQTWRTLPISSMLKAPLFMGQDGLIRSVRLSEGDKEIKVAFPILQIETVPDHPGRIYVLSGKGLLRSDDGGGVFRRLALADGVYYGINQIVIDPQDSEIMFASVGINSLQKSIDGGCSWVEVYKAK